MISKEKTPLWRSAVLLIAKVAIPAALFAYLLWRVDREDYRVFFEQSKRWDLIALANLTALGAIVLSFFRWRWLVLAFNIPFTTVEALRLGFLGYLLNFVSFGSVGGDLFKAILVAKDKPQSRPEAVASVLLDRALGLLGLVTLAVVSLTVLPSQPLSEVLVWIRRSALTLVVAALLSLAVAIYSGQWFNRLIDLFERLPAVGPPLARMARAVRLLRSKPLALIGILLAAVSVHGLLAMTVYFISCGLYPNHPTLSEHLLVVPPGMAAGALPLAPGGIGYQEAAISALFGQLPNLPAGYSGTLVATVYRLITVAIAGIGLIYYWYSHGREFEFAAERV